MGIEERQEAYSFVHHNCCDVACEILHVYGCEELPASAAEYVPNDRYDALPGQSLLIEERPFISQHTHSLHHLVREIAPGVSPSWEELLLLWEMMPGHVRVRCLLSIKFMVEQWRRVTYHALRFLFPASPLYPAGNLKRPCSIG